MMDVVFEVFDELKEYKDELKSFYLFVSEKNNDGKNVILSKNKKSATILLALLRPILDKTDLVKFLQEQENLIEKQNIKGRTKKGRLINCLFENEKEHVIKSAIDKSFEGVEVFQMSIWTLERVYEFYKNGGNEDNGHRYRKSKRKKRDYKKIIKSLKDLLSECEIPNKDVIAWLKDDGLCFGCLRKVKKCKCEKLLREKEEWNDGGEENDNEE